MGFDDENVPRRSSWLIHFFLFAAMAIFLLAASIIYYRFWMTPETNCSLVVKGTPALVNCKAVVDRVTSQPDMAIRLQDSFKPINQFEARFFLPSGTYKVTVVDGDGRQLHTEPGEFIPPGRRLTLDLRRKFAATLPAIPIRP